MGLLGALAQKTVVLVTNQLQFVRPANLIVLMDKGRVVEAGSYDELVASGQAFAKLMASAEVGNLCL